MGSILLSHTLKRAKGDITNPGTAGHQAEEITFPGSPSCCPSRPKGTSNHCPSPVPHAGAPISVACAWHRLLKPACLGEAGKEPVAKDGQGLQPRPMPGDTGKAQSSLSCQDFEEMRRAGVVKHLPSSLLTQEGEEMVPVKT